MQQQLIPQPFYLAYRIAAIMFTLSMACSVSAAELEYDLAGGAAFSPTIVPQQQLALEQNLPAVRYDRAGNTDLWTIQSNMLARIGVGHATEVRLGWDGPIIRRMSTGGHLDDSDHQDNGLGDATIGIKRALQTNDPAMRWAVLVQVNLATADEGFGIGERRYTLGSSLVYDYSSVIKTGMTMYYDKQGDDLAWSAVPNVQYVISPRWSGAADLQYRKQESQAEQWHLTNSLTYQVHDNLQLTGALGYGFGQTDARLNGALTVGYLF